MANSVFAHLCLSNVAVFTNNPHNQRSVSEKRSHTWYVRSTAGPLLVNLEVMRDI